MYGCMARREEDDSEGRDEEVIEADLLCSVDIRCLIKVCQNTDGVLCKINDIVGVAEIFLDGGSRVQNWT